MKSEKELLDQMVEPDSLKTDAVFYIRNTRGRKDIPLGLIETEFYKFYNHIYDEAVVSLASTNLTKYRKGWMLNVEASYGN